MALAVAAQANPTNKRKFARTYTGAKGSKLDACVTCHVGTGVELNPYGADLQVAKSDFAAIEKGDSDADGVKNLDEILALAFPGDPNDRPGATRADSLAGRPARSDSATAAPAAKPDSSRAKPDSIRTAPDSSGTTPKTTR